MRETPQNLAEIEDSAEIQESAEAAELTPEQKALIDELLPTLLDDSPRFSDNYEEAKTFYTARDKVIEMGSKALPYLGELMLNPNPPNGNERSHNGYMFSNYANNLYEDSDYTLILDTLKNPSIIFNPDGSSVGVLARTLKKICYSIRKENPDDPRLEEIAKTLVDDLLESDITHRLGGSKLHNILDPLIWTGTETAKKFMDTTDIEVYYPANRRYLDADINDLELPRSSSDDINEFKSWAEAEADLNERLERQRMHEANEIDLDRNIDSMAHDTSWYDRDFLDDRDYFGDLDGFNYRAAGESFTSISPKPEFTPPTEEMYNAVKDVNDLIPSFSLEYTTDETARLHLFNFLVKTPHATAQELNREMNKLNKLSELESIYSREDNPLPTIGIEIEIPDNVDDGLNSEKRDLLTQLEISNIYGGLDLWEVNPRYSYSPNVQAQAIQELAKMGVIPMLQNPEKDLTPLGKINNKTHAPLSLHVNLGFPGEIKSITKEDNSSEMAQVVNCVTYAFTSPDRIVSRKTNTSFHHNQEASESKKSKSPTGFNDMTRYGGGVSRLEIRSLEFKDYTSFRQLSETQRIGALLFTHLKQEQGLELNETEKDLLPLWGSFSAEVKGLSEKYHLRGNEVDYGQDRLYTIMTDTNLCAEARQIITKYSKAVMSHVKPLLESTELAKELKESAATA